jgi:hypothetical protein
MNKRAIISSCKQYRYSLTRVIGDSKKCCLFIMLNPSTADATEDDPTIRRCIGFAKSWGCGELIVVNLFSYRATRPEQMIAATDPIGQFTDHHIDMGVARVRGMGGYVVCAWGNHGNHIGRDEQILNLINFMGIKPLCLRQTGRGQPSHPLYLPKDLLPVPLERMNAG